MKFTILTFLSVQFSGIKDIHIAVLPSRSSISRNFSSSQIEILNLQNRSSPSSLLQPPATSIPLSVSPNLATLRTSSQWNHTVYVLL